MSAQDLSRPRQPSITDVANLANCDREPIHIPGSVQPHGVLLALDEQGTIRFVSENSEALLGLSPRLLLGNSITDLLVGESAYELARRLAQLRPGAAPQAAPRAGELRLCMALQLAGRRFDAAVHTTGDLTLLEIEPAAARARDELEHEEFIQSMVRFQHAASLHELAAVAAEVFRELTGYDRVMVYRFDADNNGEILAEQRRADLESFLGLHYPSTDIPAQAHALYLRGRLRMIVDIDYMPVPLVPRADPGSRRPLDLGVAWLRSVSPIHIEYLRNMGVRGTLVLSLVCNGRLWGLISCHHYAPRLLSQRHRQRCEVYAQALANQIAAAELSEQLRARAGMQLAQRRLIEAAAACPSAQISSALVAEADALLAAVRATGAAIWADAHAAHVGRVPGHDALRRLTLWLDSLALRGPYACASMAAELPWMEPLKDVAAGLLALPLSETGGHYLLWFRPEIPQTVTWGGQPAKVVEADGDGVRLSPRKSFEQWKQIVELYAEPWGPLEIESAVVLQRLGDIAMRKRLAGAV